MLNQIKIKKKAAIKIIAAIKQFDKIYKVALSDFSVLEHFEGGQSAVAGQFAEASCVVFVLL